MNLLSELLSKLNSLPHLTCENILETVRFNHTLPPKSFKIFTLLHNKNTNTDIFSEIIALANGFESYNELEIFIKSDLAGQSLMYLLDSRKLCFAHTGSIVLDFALLYNYPEISIEIPPEHSQMITNLKLHSVPSSFKIKFSIIKEVANLYFTETRKYMNPAIEKPLAFDLPFKEDGSLDYVRELLHYASACKHITKIFPNNTAPYYLYDEVAYQEDELKNKIQIEPLLAQKLRYIILDAFFNQETTRVNQI